MIADPDAPDLIIESSSWIDHAPLPGNKVGVEGVYRITVKNNGKTKADHSTIRFTCTPLGGGPPAPAKMTGSMTCPVLYPEKTSQLAWPPISTETWKDGKYSLRIELDATKTVSEINESNNTKNVTFSAMPKVPPGSSVNNQLPGTPSAAVIPLVTPDLIIQNITMTPSHPAADEPIHYVITFRNIGRGKSGPSFTDYTYYHIGSNGSREHLRGSNLFTTPALLNPGEIQTFSFSDILAPDKYVWSDDIKSGDTIEAVFEIKKDYTNAIPESDETNNKKIITFTIK